MATRRLHPENWSSPPQTRIYTRNAKEPRDERVQLPKSLQRSRPTPINIAPGSPSPLLKASSPAQNDHGDSFDIPCEPEIVDVAAPNTWQRRGTPQKHPNPKRFPSPNMTSQPSPRQSEISFGVLDYYMSDPSPLHSPEFPPPPPRIDTPIIDPAIEKFDFGLMPKHHTPRGTSTHDLLISIPQATPGAESENAMSSHIITPPPARPQPGPKNSYRLFPPVKDSTPPSISIEPTELQSPPYSTPTNKVNSIRAYSQPDPSYRPRKESLSSSVRSRKDSFTSFCGTRRIPMRLLVGSSVSTAKTRSSASTSTTTASPLEQSRWSDDTITSPVVATTPGPRASFGSLLGRDSAQYPDCFFEDDDEDAPLRRKFAWKRSASLNQGHQARMVGRLIDDRDSFSSRLRSVLLCGGCCGQNT